MSKLIIANWKMNNTISDALNFAKYLKKHAKKQKSMVVCPPSTMLYEFSKSVKGVCSVGAQNCHYENSGAFTGEISPAMAKDAGAEYVLVGHSERRKNFNEDNEIISKKIASALKAGLKVIFCVGETLEEKNKYKSVLKKQILEGLKLANNLENVIIAYEPIWAIGTGKVATLADIEKVHLYIKGLIEENFGTEIKVIYGGSVKPSNSEEILELADVDGVLVGGASLIAEDFVKIVESRG